MPSYQHTQIGWVTLIATLGSILVIFGVALPSLAGAIPILLFVILVGVAATFSSLSVTIDDDNLSFRFGLTPFRKRIPLSDIASFRAVRNRWYYGWGIRYIGTGWLYNVSGLDAVEVERLDGTRVRIGTDEPGALERALSIAVGDERKSEAVASAPANRLWWLVPIGIAAMIAAVLVAGFREPTVTVTAEAFTVAGGMYRAELPIAAIQHISLEERLPRVLRRTNGFGAGTTLRGWFDLDDLGRGRLFVRTDRPPHVFVKSADEYLFVSYADPDQTRRLHDELQGVWQRATGS